MSWKLRVASWLLSVADCKLNQAEQLAIRSQSLSKNVMLNFEQLHRSGLAFSPSTWNVSKIKNLKQSNFGQSVFFRAQNALCSKTGGTIIGLRVSKQDGMVFSSSPTWRLLSLVKANQSIPTQFWCRSQKIWGKRISSLETKGKWKSRIMDAGCVLDHDLLSAYRCHVTE